MRLYFIPGTCSLSPHIILRELGMPFDLDLVDRKTKITASGVDYLTKNPKGYVPALELDDGKVLTEVSVIGQYLADHNPEAHLAPPLGTFARYEFAVWLNYVATELHKGFSPLFSPKANEEYKQSVRDALTGKLRWLDGELASRPFLAGESFSIVDAYAYVILTWFPRAPIDLTTFPNVKAFFDRVAHRPSVRAALVAEKDAVAAAATSATAR